MDNETSRSAKRNSPAGQLVKRLRTEREWTLEDLSARVGVTKANISAIENGILGIKTDKRRLIAQAFGLTLDQFDAMWRPDQEQSLRSSPLGIPVINAAPAGRVVDYDHVHYDEFNTAHEYLPRAGIEDKLAYAVVIVGDSMEPTLVEGDRVVFGPVMFQDKQRYTPRDGDVVMVRCGPDAKTIGVTVGRYFSRGEKTFEIRKDNKKYKPVMCIREEVVQMGLALELRRTRL